MSRLKTAIVGAFLLGFLAAMYVLFKSYTIEKKKINLAA
jgi:hypothetical protein